jgi:hypothetical protein
MWVAFIVICVSEFSVPPRVPVISLRGVLMLRSLEW